MSASGPALLRKKLKMEQYIINFPGRASTFLPQIEKINQQLKDMHACSVCGRPLRGEKSRERGVGEECLRKSKEENKDDN